ncbi:methyltransferase domain-containing protein [Streptomyces sp. 8L]|uniref:methyltransferase domain-containing protein n=1 Tax=Streptomyces sp. 8L TaxID=2877242 RepID=UPI001CD20053|nr:methyltransferase domain-containing protein [Streptomyces sp. 8L]MCA1218984.1 methyltransferase type 11 [Streptomyces sp. 8L]
MVAARDAFLSAGHFAPLSRALARICAGVAAGGGPGALPACGPGPVLDAGTGTGHYLAAVLDALPPGAAYGLGLDVSRYALRRAARAHPGLAAARWDVRQGLPVADGSVPLVLNVFAPRNPGAFHRALRPGGALVVVVPTRRHLAELRIPLGLLAIDPTKEVRLRLALSDFFRETHSEVLEYSTSWSAENIYPLIAMGPTAHHVDPAELAARLSRMRTPVHVTSSFRLVVHRPR